MNNIDIASREAPPPEWSRGVQSFIQTVLIRLNIDNWDLSVVFCGDDFIRSLNRQYRGKDESTDVLSFPQGSGVGSQESGIELRLAAAGDIVISLDTLYRTARELRINADEELKRLLVHGILHLSGYNHESYGLDSETLQNEPMLFLQEQLLENLKDPRIITEKGGAA